MADSNITKRALASALKELLLTAPLSKISVGDICEKCEMNRKSFYYHFKDKEDLVNWIFDTEAPEYTGMCGFPDSWDAIVELGRYFYENRSFYRKVLRHEGQNSFVQHFEELIYPFLQERIRAVTGIQEIRDYQVTFITDGIIAGLKRWLSSSDCIPPDELVGELREYIYLIARHIYLSSDKRKA